jgi:hypothetical protein
MLGLGVMAWHEADYKPAAMCYSQRLVLQRASGVQIGVAVTLKHRGELARHQEEFQQARALNAESLAGFQSLGNRQGCEVGLERMGQLAIAPGTTAPGSTE